MYTQKHTMRTVTDTTEHCILLSYDISQSVKMILDITSLKAHEINLFVCLITYPHSLVAIKTLCTGVSMVTHCQQSNENKKRTFCFEMTRIPLLLLSKDL